MSCSAKAAPVVVNAMIEHPAVRKINFTGSTAVGRKIAETCRGNLKPCLMELGGKNSAIVCADADLELAANNIVAGSFLNVSGFTGLTGVEVGRWRRMLTMPIVWADLHVH